MRAVLAALLLAPCLVAAQSAPAVDATADSAAASSPPVLDALRLFNATEAYQLEPGGVRAEVRFASGAPDTVPTMEVRAEVGVTRHLQLSLAEELSEPPGQGVQTSATPISLRYSLGAHEDEIAGNPAIEAVLMPRPNAPLRAGLRLLVAEELLPRLVVAANSYVEQNLDRDSPAGVDGTFGMTGGSSFAVVPDHLRVGAEGQLGAAQYGRPSYQLVMAAGPNAVLAAGPAAVTLTALFDLSQRHVGFEPMATVGGTF